MPVIAKGVAKSVAISKQANFDTPAPAGASRLLRRVTASFNLVKETYQSEEIRTSYQLADMRHGVRSATGELNGELSAGSYFDLQEGLLARDYTVIAPIAGLSITVAASGLNYTLTRAAGSWITDGVNPGKVVRLTAGAFAVANLNKNILVMQVTALVLTVKVLNNSSMAVEGPIATATLSTPGKQTFAPLTNHTDQSFTVEERYTDINQYERFDGLKVTSMKVNIPATGMTTTDFSLVGKDMGRAAVTPYFTAPTAQSSTGIMAGVNGALLLNGQAVALITSADFGIERATENAVVVGSNTLADIFTGKITASGNLSIYFVDGVSRDLFSDETEFTLVFALTESNLAAANVISVSFPRVKLGGFEKADAELGIMASSPFTALENSVVTGGLQATTVSIQDTSLV